MTRRLFGSAAVSASIAAAAAVVVLSPSLHAQNAAAPPLLVTAFGGQPHPYKAPRTPWGEPDIEGVDNTLPPRLTPRSRAVTLSGSWTRTSGRSRARGRRANAP